MGECKNRGDLSGEFANADTFSQYWDIGLEGPDGSPLFAVSGNDGVSTVISANDYPDTYGEPQDWGAQLAVSQEALLPAADNAAGAIMMSSLALNGDPQLSGILSTLNIASPSFDDLAEYREILVNLDERFTGLIDDYQDLSVVAGMAEANGSSLDDVRGRMARAHEEVKIALEEISAVIECDPNYALLNGVEEGLRNQGVSDIDIEAAFSVTPEFVDEGLNAHYSVPKLQ